MTWVVGSSRVLGRSLVKPDGPGCKWCETVLDANTLGVTSIEGISDDGLCNDDGTVRRADCSFQPGEIFHRDYETALAALQAAGYLHEYGPPRKGARVMFEMLDVLRVLLAANIPVKLESLPGAGKTSYLNALWRASGGYLHTMVAVNHDPTDFGGIPAPDLANGNYKLLPGQWATEVGLHAETGQLTGIFLDEVNTAGRAVLSACLKLVDERRVGNYQLPGSVRMILAMNPPEANGGVDLTPAMANRCAHVPFLYPAEDWSDGIVNGFPDPAPLVLPEPADVAAALGKWTQAVASFTRKSPNLLDTYPEEAALRTKAFSTRRTWTMAAHALATAEALGLPNVGMECVATLVGRNAADAFADWHEAQTSIDVTDALKEPDSFVFPTNDAELFATLDRILDVALDPAAANQQADLNAAGVLLVRIAQESGRPGVAMSGIKRLSRYINEHRELLDGEMKAHLRVFQPMLAGEKGGDDW